MTKGPLSGDMANFVFDSRNRLIQSGDTVYRYDAENQRIGVNQIQFVVNSQPALSQVLVKEDNGQKTFYVYGLGLIGQESNGEYLSYHFYLRGSTVVLTDSSSQVTKRFQYSPYGLRLSGDASITPFLFNGMYGVMSDSNGLYYMRARYYSPKIRRFVNQDILLGNVASGQTLNQYAYVNGNPVSFIDPEGKLGFLAGIGIGLGIWATAEILIPTLFPPYIEADSGEVIPSALPDIVSGVGRATKTTVNSVIRVTADQAGAKVLLHGSGPVAGIIEASTRVKSVKALLNYFPKGGEGIEFVFDPKKNICGPSKITSDLWSDRFATRATSTKYRCG
jgi:RHS repeat-associated protein